MVQTSTTGERMLSELTSLFFELPKEIEVGNLQAKLSDVISRYEIKLLDYEGSNLDLQEKIGLFLSAKKLEGLSKLTLDGYALDLDILTRHLHKKTDEITTADLRVYLAKFPHLKLSSINKRVSVLKSFFGWLTAEEILQRDPTKKIKPPKYEKRLPKALTIEELEMLREGCQTIRQRAFIEILYATGCRLSEVYALNRIDINWQTQSTQVIGKGNKQREVFLSFKSMYHLKKYLMNRLDQEEALFITERQPYRRLSRRGIQREIAKIAQQAGLAKKISPHCLRHTFATLTLNNGAELAAVQALLGHSRADTTLIYAQITDERKREQHKKYLVQ